MEAIPVQLDYGSDDAQAPSAAVVRPVLLVVGAVHALAAFAFFVPSLVVWWFRIDVGGWSSQAATAATELPFAAAFAPTSIAFLIVCLWAVWRPAGGQAAARVVRLAALAYLTLWLVDGLRVACALAIETPRPSWIVIAAAVGAGVAREAGQASILVLIFYAFGRRPPTAARVLRLVAWAAVVACALQVVQRGFFTMEMVARRYATLPPDRRISFVLNNRMLRNYCVVTASYAIVGLLAFGTFRRRPRLAGALVVAPFLLTEVAARGTLWTAFSVDSVAESIFTVTYELSFIVFCATTPIAAFTLFTLLGRRLPVRGAETVG